MTCRVGPLYDIVEKRKKIIKEIVNRNIEHKTKENCNFDKNRANRDILSLLGNHNENFIIQIKAINFGI
jgi:hypothetical protein